ncbi:TPA: hypothetical protein ROX91_001954 [Bacillus cereus]|nr:hypothetical protein [Bacillus cereus]
MSIVKEIKHDGYHLVIYRHPELGTLNGYVGVNRSHPWFGLHYDSSKVYDIMVHGGLTFSGKNFKKKYWYFGFDTAHCMDIVPSIHRMMKEAGLESSFLFEGQTLKDVNYVEKEIEGLLEQLQEAKAKRPDYKYNHVREYKRLRKIKIANRSMRRFYA